ncbi:argininosuccinate lyase [Chloroflexota bacterium]
MNHLRGRFSKQADAVAASYSASVGYDQRLALYDIAGSIAHARMLAKQAIISEIEAQAIVGGLKAILAEIESGQFQFRADLEDIHMNIEAALIARIGEVGGKLHTARSRNDQVALDTRLFVKDAVAQTLEAIVRFQQALVDIATANQAAVMPGYTHLQPAQPVLFAHFEMMERDKTRFAGCMERADVMPLGSGALAGVPYPIDREFVARELGFSRVSPNSMDAVADRDYILDYLSAVSICMMHLSRLAEEIILWSSPGFGYVTVDDAYATSSSLMPQKKNPDMAELARGKTGRVYGHLMALLTTMKGLPLTYNRDMQEDKEGLFDTVDTLNGTLAVFSGMVGSMKINTAKMAKALVGGNLLATDVADYLVAKRLSFREAHRVVGELVAHASADNREISSLTLEEYQKFSPRFEKDVMEISVENSLTLRGVVGATAPEAVKKALTDARQKLK